MQKTVLLVEEKPLASVELEETLSRIGFEVIVANNGDQALREFERHADRLEAVITDIQLGPGPNGWYVGQRVREMKSDVLIVYMSGGSAHIWSTEAAENSVIVSKPFAVGAVMDAMSKLSETQANALLPHPANSNVRGRPIRDLAQMDEALDQMIGKMAVLEIVSMTSLALALEVAGCDKNNSGKEVLDMMRIAVDQKCEEMLLSQRATNAAQSYVEELVITAIYSLYPAPA
jgi:DNA-binding response OmpR family regulator